MPEWTFIFDLCAADRAGWQFKCHNSPDIPVCSCPLGEQLVNKTRCEPENECLDREHVPSTVRTRNTGSRAVAIRTMSWHRTRGPAKWHRIGMKCAFMCQTGTEYIGLITILTIGEHLRHSKFGEQQPDATVDNLPTAERPLLHGLRLDRNLYVGNKLSQTIEVVMTQGEQYRSIILQNDQSPTAMSQSVGIAVDSDKGLLFWLDQGKGGVSTKVARADLDGNNPLVLVNIDLAELDHLALDTINHRVYFTEAKAGRE